MNDYSPCAQATGQSQPGKFRPAIRSGLPQAEVGAQQFATNLRFWRETAGLARKQAADQLGMAHSTWCQWERGKREPSLANIYLLCQILHISTCSLLAANPKICLICPRRKG
jgi:DNA-binding XRE family transcriptional regulator